jgi:hypothetical protein
MHQRTADQAAILIAILLKRSGMKRARISEATIRRLSRRRHLRRSFLGMLEAHVTDYGITMSELDTGGYGLIPSAALSGAPAISAKKYMIEDLEKLKKNNAHWDRMRAELETDLAPDEEEDN